MILRFADLEKKYGDRTLFHNVNLTLEKGEVAAIMGVSGQGKSTLLKIAAGLASQDKGEAVVRTKRIGYVFQEPRLLPWFTAQKNIALVLGPLGYSGKEAAERAKELLAEMELSGFEEYYPAQLSGGMKQRVSICRAMAVEPELLLLDETFTGLDPDLRNGVRERMNTMIARVQSAVLHVTHDPAELMACTGSVYALTTEGLVKKSSFTG